MVLWRLYIFQRNELPPVVRSLFIVFAQTSKNVSCLESCYMTQQLCCLFCVQWRVETSDFVIVTWSSNCAVEMVLLVILEVLWHDYGSGKHWNCNRILDLLIAFTWGEEIKMHCVIVTPFFEFPYGMVGISSIFPKSVTPMTVMMSSNLNSLHNFFSCMLTAVI